MKFLAQCITGLQDVVAAQLVKDKVAARISGTEEGLVVFEAPGLPRGIASLGYVNNYFVVIHEGGPAHARRLDDFLVQLARQTAWQNELVKTVARHERSFRLVLSDENVLVPGPRDVLNTIVASIERATRLRRSPRGADVEFWVMRRRSGAIYLSKRISRRERTERDLRKGELRPELAQALCLLSEPSSTDVILDPFAGSGAIGFARAEYPYNIMFLFDVDAAAIKAIRDELKAGRRIKERKGSPIIARVGDARHLDKIDSGFVDKVLTDPPWGFFDTSIADLPEFYHQAMTELCRVTRAGGVIVMLLGRREMVEELARDFAAELNLERRLDILVSGKKAVVAKWRRK